MESEFTNINIDGDDNNRPSITHNYLLRYVGMHFVNSRCVLIPYNLTFIVKMCCMGTFPPSK